MSAKILFRYPVLVLGAGLALLAPTSADAKKPKVLVLPYQHLNTGMPDDLGEQTTVVVAREMSAQGVSVIRADDVGASNAPQAAPAASDAPTGDPGAQSRAESLIERARDAMDDSEFERATRLLRKAAKLMQSNGDAVADLRLLPEIYLQAGVAYFRDGMEDEGDDMLNKAVHMAPNRKLEESDYPPIFIRVFDRARFNVLRRPRARIEVKAKSGATVLFDGRNMGKAPIVLEEALPGSHWIRIEQPGEPVQVRKIRARGKKTLVVEFSGAGNAPAADVATGGVLGAISGNKVGEDEVAQLVRAGKKAGADFVLFGGIYKTDTAYQIRTAYLKVRNRKVGRLTEIAFDLDMLSAEIEVFKLVDDVKKQAEAGTLSQTEDARPFVLARKMRAARRRRIARPGAKETRLTTAIAAPPAIKPPRIPDPGVAVAANGRAPVATGSGTRVKRPVDKKPTLIPKDEVGTAMAKPAQTSPDLRVGTLVPKDEDPDDDDGSLWWLWVIAGVAAAGAAAAGGVVVAGGGNSDQGNLTVNW